jgi:hypothetical protein
MRELSSLKQYNDEKWIRIITDLEIKRQNAQNQNIYEDQFTSRLSSNKNKERWRMKNNFQN